MLEKLLNCKLVYALVALVLSFLMILQEESLGSSNIWVIALYVAADVGLVGEVVNYFKFTGRFNWLNVLSALAGGVIAIIIALLKWGSC